MISSKYLCAYRYEKKINRTHTFYRQASEYERERRRTTTTAKYHSTVTSYVIGMTQGYNTDLPDMHYDFNLG